MALWNLIDLNVRPCPVHLKDSDRCYYAREYLPEGGYQASETNQLILNFKMHPSHKDVYRWRYKREAAKQFAHELALFLPRNGCIALIPTSRPYEHPEHDPRFYLMLAELIPLRSDLAVFEPVIRAVTCQALHMGGKRSPQDLLQTLGWQGFEAAAVPDRLFLIDDVITSGSTFRACKSFLHQNCPNLDVVGAFWARSVRRSEDDPL